MISARFISLGFFLILFSAKTQNKAKTPIAEKNFFYFCVIGYSAKKFFSGRSLFRALLTWCSTVFSLRFRRRAISP